MKNKIILLIAGCFLFMLSSCLKNNEWESYYEVDKNTQIKTFSLTSDSVSALAKVAFTIDQINGRIMNLDSMEYGTKIDRVICNMTYGSYAKEIKVMAEAKGDTVSYNAADSIDFSKPVKFVVYASDGQSIRTYIANINIHQVVPDSMVWNMMPASSFPGIAMDEQKVVANEDNTYSMYAHEKGKEYHLYTSADLKEWTERSLSGLPTSGLRLSEIVRFNGMVYMAAVDGGLYESADGMSWQKVENAPNVKAVLGSMEEHTNQNARLALLVNDANAIKYAVMGKDGAFETGIEVPAGFPVEGFAARNIYLMYKDRILLAGGKNKKGALLQSTWSTLDGLNWAEQTDAYDKYLFGKREGASLAIYDNQYYLIGGLDESGKPLKDIYRSSDHGVTWEYVDEMVVLPEEYQARGYASLIVDADNFMTIIGGKSSASGQILTKNWRGRINRLAFDRQ